MIYKLLSSTAIFLLGAGAVLAADLPANAPSLIHVAPVYSWSGFYVGAQVGYARDNSSRHMDSPAGVELANWGGSVSGAVGGLYTGYNWQWSSFVFGVEADFEASGLKKSSGPVIGLYDTADIKWQGSLRGRLGYAADRALFYVTGGLADASIDHTLYDASHSLSFTSNRLGLALGAGAESAFTDNLIGRIEYRYTDFGAGSNALNYLNWIGVTGNFYNRRVTEQAVRFGLSYKFGP
jgi:outer membrane immunogenic protein